MSALLYGCESWVGADLKPMIKLYNWAIKQLLGVRKSTPNDVCYAEIGYPSLPDLIRRKQHKFYKKIVMEREDLPDDPFMFALGVSTRENTPMSTTIRSFLYTDIPDMCDLMRNVHERIASSGGSRCIVYRTLNPSLSVHRLYTERHVVNDRLRVSFTRFRVSGHSLAIETGRWNRRGRGRLPVEERLCVCGQVQDEKHVVETCPFSRGVRQLHGLFRIEDLFNHTYNDEKSCKIIYDILKLYD